MAARKILACISLIAFVIAVQPAVAQNGNDPAPANPSTGPAPAKHGHKNHTGKHRRQQKPAPLQQGSSAGANG